jgi:excisionase family DNA binding protein
MILTPEQVAEMFALTVRQVKRAVNHHKVPVLRVGRDMRFDPAALAAFTEAIRCPSKSFDASQRGLSRSPERSRGSASSVGRRVTDLLSPKKRPRYSKPDCSAENGTANVVALDHSTKPSKAT